MVSVWKTCCQMSGTFIAKHVITSDMPQKKSTAVQGITLFYHCMTASFGPFNILDP